MQRKVIFTTEKNRLKSGLKTINNNFYINVADKR